jgi:GxxExxY protein
VHGRRYRDLPEPDLDLDQLAHDAIGAAIEVHRVLGPGFLESVYEEALAIEFGVRDVAYQRQVPLAIDYRGQPIAQQKLDFVVGGRLIIELKAVETLAPIHVAQLMDEPVAPHPCPLGKARRHLLCHAAPGVRHHHLACLQPDRIGICIRAWRPRRLGGSISLGLAPSAAWRFNPLATLVLPFATSRCLGVLRGLAVRPSGITTSTVALTLSHA